MTVHDGRTVAAAEWGDPDGFPVFSLHGAPGRGSAATPTRTPSASWASGSSPTTARLRRLHPTPGAAGRGLRRRRRRDRGRPRHRAVRGDRWVRRGAAASPSPRGSPTGAAGPVRGRGGAFRRRGPRLLRGDGSGEHQGVRVRRAGRGGAAARAREDGGGGPRTHRRRPVEAAVGQLGARRGRPGRAGGSAHADGHGRDDARGLPERGVGLGRRRPRLPAAVGLPGRRDPRARRGAVRGAGRARARGAR